MDMAWDADLHQIKKVLTHPYLCQLVFPHHKLTTKKINKYKTYSATPHKQASSKFYFPSTSSNPEFNYAGFRILIGAHLRLNINDKKTFILGNNSRVKTKSGVITQGVQGTEIETIQKRVNKAPG